ncbi:ribonuclease P protein component [Salinimicrobium sp. GXAS 041]|uniref:ribonuclease P protein component n=1 Tax=Salinimicrobium sp. GXAS 041 TaxID=3400806 RepID=UPI003C78AA4E
MNESFGRKEKLKSKILITRLFTEGKSLNKYPLKLVYLPVSEARYDTLQTAVSVPKRNFKKAVDRIYLKRLMREAFRKNKYLVTSNMDLKYALMFIYIGREQVCYQKLFKVTEELLKRFTEKELK